MDAHFISGVLPHATTPHPYFALPLFPLDPVCHHWPLDWLLFLLLPMLLLQLLLWTLPAQIIGARRGLLRVPRGSWGADQDRHGKRWSKMKAELVRVLSQVWPSMRSLWWLSLKWERSNNPMRGISKTVIFGTSFGEDERTVTFPRHREKQNLTSLKRNHEICWSQSKASIIHHLVTRAWALVQGGLGGNVQTYKNQACYLRISIYIEGSRHHKKSTTLDFSSF